MVARRKKSARDKAWVVGNAAPEDFVHHSDYHPVIATLLHQRNLHAPHDLTTFFDASYPDGLHDPLLFRGMAPASDRIAAAIANDEPVAVYGDYDTDGVTASALLVQALTAMGAHVTHAIPRREDGYGLHSHIIAALAEAGIRLLITVDCGISNVHEVEQANQHGIDVIVTDHHHPPPTLPPALAIINPKQAGCAYPYKQLVGVGIAFKLVQALVTRNHLRMNMGRYRNHPLRLRDFLDLVALGTVTDLGPLDGENRLLVKAGLDALQQTSRPGVRALIRVAGLKPAMIDSIAIGFMLGPRLNAAGRLGDASDAFDLLLTEDAVVAQRLAQKLNQANQERQRLTREIQAAAQAQAEAQGKHEQRIVMISSEHYPAGVVGLVAGKLVEQWARPVLLVERGPETSTGSARSIQGFNIIEALEQCRDLFQRHGGHSMAAGFTLATERLPELDARLQHLAAEHLSDALLVPRLMIDTPLHLNDITWALFHDLQQLEPFGQANVQPVFLSEGVEVVQIDTMGRENQHLRLQLCQQQGTRHEAVAFGLGHLAEPLRKYPHIDIAYTLGIHEWNDVRSLQLTIKDFRRAE